MKMSTTDAHLLEVPIGMKTFDELKYESATHMQIKHTISVINDSLSALRLNLYRNTSTKRVSKETSPDKSALIINLSDTHFGKNVHNTEENSEEEIYNIRIAKRRLSALFERAREEYVLRSNDFDEVVINMVGDHIEGDGNIYPSQSYELLNSAMEQVNLFVDALMAEVYLFSRLIGKKGIIRIFGVPGNHGKIKSNRVIDPRNNWDTLAYKWIELHILTSQKYKDLLNVSIDYPNQNIIDKNYIKYDVKGWRVYLRHILPTNFTTPAGVKAIQSIILSDKNKTIDLMITGHMHSESLASISGCTVIRVNSLVGMDEFARNIFAAESNPGQNILITTPQEKIKHYIPLNLGHIA